jgi:hypothetical protein
MTVGHLPVPARPAAEAAPTLRGKVVYMFAFDVAYEMLPVTSPTLLGEPVAQFEVSLSKRAPRNLVFHRPQTIRLPPLELLGPAGQLRIERSVKLLPVGAISISFAVPFEAERLEELVALHDLRLSAGRTLAAEARDLAERLRQELLPWLVRPTPRLSDDEAYTVFCLERPVDLDHLSAEQWLLEHRRQVAAVLTEESDPNYLSNQEADESSARYYSYSAGDVVVIDWDAALVIDEPNGFGETLYVMELANVQLAELEAYDRILDEVVDRSYRDVSSRGWRGWIRQQRELREIRVDMARLSDELGNISKFFGDWHLARVYGGVAERFHLADWHRSIDGKLRTLDHIYGLLASDRTNRWMITLEAIVVLLFILEIVKSFLGQ